MLVDVVGGCDTPVCVEVGGLTAAAAAAAYLIGNGAVARGCGGGGFGFNIDIDAGEGFEANKKSLVSHKGNMRQEQTIIGYRGFWVNAPLDSGSWKIK